MRPPKEWPIDNRAGRQALNHVCITPGDVIKTLVGYGGSVVAGTFDIGRVARPAGRYWVVARGTVQLNPGLPSSRMDPQAVDEDDGNRGISHNNLQES